jgi:MYXO-CTERM domain-containing protein
MRPILPATAALALFTLPALAFAPRAEAPTDAEPTRLASFDRATQDALRDDPAWARFFKATGGAWTVHFDEATGAPLRLWGAGLPIDASSPASLERDLRDLLGRHADALRAPLKSLEPARASYSDDLDTWYVDLPVAYDGVPVYRGAVTARVRSGRLLMLGVQAYADAPRTGRRALDATAATLAAIDASPAADAWHDPVDAREVWLPRDDAGPIVLRRAWQVTTTTQDPIGRWVHFVDAETGELLHAHDEIRWIDGTVEGLRNPRRPGQGLVRQPLSGLLVRNGAGATAFTAADGTFTLSGAGFTALLRGPNVIVVDADRRNTATVALSDGLALFDTSVATQGEIDNFAAVQEVRAWADLAAPEVIVGDGRGGVLASNVNRRDGTCNAFYDGASINFFRAGNGCVNTAQIADVTWHEWGHGFHAYSLRAGVFDGAISEGASDTVAFLMSDDNIIGRGFFGTGDRGIRDVDTMRVYPRDVVNQVHTDGLILGGALWELISALEPRYGRDEARRVVGRLIAGALKGGPTLATVGPELLFADDDDADLSNGSPHYCELTSVLGRRGLLPASAPLNALRHEQRVDAPADRPFDLTAEILPQLAACADLGALEAVYRVDGGDWLRAPAAMSGSEARAGLPALPFGSFVEYYLQAGDLSVPSGAFASPLSLYVGGVLPITCEDFEASSGGYASELLGGVDGLGANDWQWDWPRGRGGDPARAFSGRNVWGTDLGMRVDGQRFDGQYQADKHTRLQSPQLTFPPHYQGVFLRYARWLTVEDGVADVARVLADGDVVWTNHESQGDGSSEHHLDDGWVIHSVDLGAATDDGQVRVAWELLSDSERQYGGWTLDDVCLVAPATPNNRLAIVDLTVSPGAAEGVALSWTNPRWAPLREVVVVRTEGAPPTGPSDGEVVFRAADPQLGAAASTVDLTSIEGRSYWYAVYGGDGDAWLGWTVEGRNLVAANGVSGGVTSLGGCGCATDGAAPAGLLVLGPLLLAAARRRRPRA